MASSIFQIPSEAAWEDSPAAKTESTGLKDNKPVSRGCCACCDKECFGHRVGEYLVYMFSLLNLSVLAVGAQYFNSCPDIPGGTAFCVTFGTVDIITGTLQFFGKTMRAENKDTLVRKIVLALNVGFLGVALWGTAIFIPAVSDPDRLFNYTIIVDRHAPGGFQVVDKACDLNVITTFVVQLIFLWGVLLCLTVSVLFKKCVELLKRRGATRRAAGGEALLDGRIKSVQNV